MSFFQGHRNLAAGLCLLANFLVTSAAYGRSQQNWAPGQAPPGFHVLEVRGVAHVLRPGAQGAITISPEAALATADVIDTGPGGYVRVGLDDGSQVEIFPGSRVQLGVARSSWIKMLDLFLGQVRIMIEHIGGKPNPYTFGTPTAVLGVRGTIFDVAVDASAATIVAVNEGIVQVENALFLGQGVLVKQGYRTIVRPNELPSKPERFSGNGANFAAMANKHGKAMEARAGGMMSGSRSGSRNAGAGTMGMPGSGTVGTPGGRSASGGMSGGDGMSGGMPPKKKEPQP